MKHLLLSLLVISLSIPLHAGIIHVNLNATGGNNGLTWASAYTDLQDAIDNANSGDEIWIAQGTYYPTKDKSGNASPADNRHKTFYINTNGIQLYGGFLGNEVLRSARDWENNLTILSGDLGSVGVKTDNSYHVMHIDGTTGNIITNSTVIDGLTIEEGHARDSSAGYPSRNGGGIYNDSKNVGSESSPTISNCTFLNNSAEWGGAISNDFNYGGNTNYVIINCVFENNYAVLGGAIDDFDNSNIPSGTVQGKIQSCIFYNNNGIFGGAYSNNDGNFNLVIENSLFVGNGTSSGEGGAIYFASEGTMDIRQCTFTGNMAQYGGAVSSRTVSGSNSVKVENSIMWNNGSNQYYRISGNNAALEFVHTLYEGYYNWSATENHLFDEDPLFVDANNPKGADNKWRTADDGLNLQYCSPAIDEGFTSLPLINTDITANTRTIDNDLGAYESIAIAPPAPVCNANSPMVPISPGLYRSKYKSAPDANGWTHFCDCDGYLVGSFNFVGTGADVPATGVAVRMHPALGEYHADGVGFVNNPDGAVFLTRKLEVYPTVQPTSPVGVRFYFTQTEFFILNANLNTFGNQAPMPSVQSMIFYKVTNPNTNVYPSVPSLSPSDVQIITNHPTSASLSTWVYGAKGSDHYAEYKVSSFSPTAGGGGAGGGGTLPVEWLSFDVKQQNNDALLSWSTATETNNLGFHIEHSQNGKDFKSIGWQNGEGNSSQIQYYDFIHRNINGTNYYRLAQEDEDGSIDYSDIKVLNSKENHSVELFPNPTKTGMLNLQYYSDRNQDLDILVFDISGKKIISQNIQLTEEVNYIPLDFSSLNSGVYMIQFNDGINSISKKLVVQ